jgi:hypothetical protein
LELLRTQDRVAAEVAQALARCQRANARFHEAEVEVQNAVESADKNLQGLGQARRIGEQVTLIFRPQEAAAAVAALDQAYRDFYVAVADGNRAQFALYRALGHPAAALASINGCVTLKEAPQPVAEQPMPPIIPVSSPPMPLPKPRASDAPPIILPAGTEVQRPEQPDGPDDGVPIVRPHPRAAPVKPQNRPAP